MNEIGKPALFDIDKWLDYVEELISSDEVEMAFKALDMCPAYYKDNVPHRAKEIRQSLNRQLWTPLQYRGIYTEKAGPVDLSTPWPMRFEILSKYVKELNDKGIVPNIMELAPGGLGSRALLEARQQSFSYESMSLDEMRLSDLESTEYNIFVAFELIEHLWNEWEIYQNYLKFEREAQCVMISTPLYTYMSMPGWRNNALGHLRTYGPNSFVSVVSKMFTGFNWTMNLDNTMCLVGEKR